MVGPSGHTPADLPVSLEDPALSGLFDLMDLMLRATKGSATELDAKGMIDTLVARTGEVVPAARWASLTVVRSGAVKTLTSSHPTARLVDSIQYELGSGPCLDAILDDHVYLTADVVADARWPEFGRRAHEETGLRSALAFRLVLLDESTVIAGLNLFSPEPEAFDDTSVRMGTMLATQCSLLLTAYLASDAAENLSRGLESNREIGVAMGVLMAKHNLTRAQSFDLLRMASQDSNRKLADIAAEVADTGALPLRRLRAKLGD